jgi:hypothetical protein
MTAGYLEEQAYNVIPRRLLYWKQIMMNSSAPYALAMKRPGREILVKGDVAVKSDIQVK